MGVIAGVLLMAGGVYFGLFRKNKVDTNLLLSRSEDQSQNGRCKLLLSFIIPDICERKSSRLFGFELLNLFTLILCSNTC